MAAKASSVIVHHVLVPEPGLKITEPDSALQSSPKAAKIKANGKQMEISKFLLICPFLVLSFCPCPI